MGLLQGVAYYCITHRIVSTGIGDGFPIYYFGGMYECRVAEVGFVVVDGAARVLNCCRFRCYLEWN